MEVYPLGPMASTRKMTDAAAAASNQLGVATVTLHVALPLAAGEREGTATFRIPEMRGTVELPAAPASSNNAITATLVLTQTQSPTDGEAATTLTAMTDSRSETPAAASTPMRATIAAAVAQPDPGAYPSGPKCNLLDLPDEMLAYIAKFLPLKSAVGIRLVCKRFQAVVPHLLPLEPLLYSRSREQKRVSLESFWLLSKVALCWSRLGAIELVFEPEEAAENVNQLFPFMVKATGLPIHCLRYLDIGLYGLRQSDVAQLSATLGSSTSGIRAVQFQLHPDLDGTECAPGVVEELIKSVASSSWRSVSNVTIYNIDLSGLCDVLAEALRVNTTIKSLKFSFNELGPAEMTSIARALESNTTLSSLCSSSNHIESPGAAALAKLISRNSTITSLDVSSNRIGSAGLLAFAEVLQTNSSITVFKACDSKFWPSWYDPRGDAEEIEQEAADVKASQVVFAAFGRMLAANRTLRTLDLSACWTDGDVEFCDENVVQFARGLWQNRTISHLHLSNNIFGCNLDVVTIVHAACASKALVQLDLRRVKVSKAVMDKLSQMYGNRVMWGPLTF